jgi:hypothetical protein
VDLAVLTTFLFKFMPIEFCVQVVIYISLLTDLMKNVR